MTDQQRLRLLAKLAVALGLPADADEATVLEAAVDWLTMDDERPDDDPFMAGFATCAICGATWATGMNGHACIDGAWRADAPDGNAGVRR